MLLAVYRISPLHQLSLATRYLSFFFFVTMFLTVTSRVPHNLQNISCCLFKLRFSKLFFTLQQEHFRRSQVQYVNHRKDEQMCPSCTSLPENQQVKIFFLYSFDLTTPRMKIIWTLCLFPWKINTHNYTELSLCINHNYFNYDDI